MIRGMTVLPALIVAALLSYAPEGRAAQVDIEVSAPAREAARALETARRARAALTPPSGAPNKAKAARLFRLAAAQARVAETRAIEVVRGREAAGAGFQYLDAIEGDPKRILPPRPSMPEAAGEYRLRQKEAAEARAARRAAEEAVERLRTQSR